MSRGIGWVRWRLSPRLLPIRGWRRPLWWVSRTTSRARRCLPSLYVGGRGLRVIPVRWCRNCATGSGSRWAPSPSRMTSGLRTICRRRGRARSCGGCCALLRAVRRFCRTCRRWRIRGFWISCGGVAPRPPGLPRLRSLRHQRARRSLRRRPRWGWQKKHLQKAGQQRKASPEGLLPGRWSASRPPPQR